MINAGIQCTLEETKAMGDVTHSKFAVVITTVDLLLFMLPDGLITVSVIVLKEIFDFLAG